MLIWPQKVDMQEHLTAASDAGNCGDEYISDRQSAMFWQNSVWAQLISWPIPAAKLSETPKSFETVAESQRMDEWTKESQRDESQARRARMSMLAPRAKFLRKSAGKCVNL
jgi:hypothetical protein